MMKQRRNRKSNQGNSFIVVVATISFLLVLTSALLVAVALCFRLKAYDINSRDNFYYLEQAMDEIYDGIGQISMQHLNNAFDETAEVIVYYDTAKKAYVTMDNSDANSLMKATYINKLKNDSRLLGGTIEGTLRSFLSNAYDSSGNPEGVDIISANIVWNSDALTIEDIVLKRVAKYSTVNTRKSASGTLAATDFIQTITTDLTISTPDFNVDFASMNSDLNELYDFVLISDRGVEIEGITTTSNIIGNVYAAADFYNKVYDESPSTSGTDDDKHQMLKNAVNSYKGDSRAAACDGVSEKSMYSGLYIGSAKVSIMADKLIVPGSIAAMNCATLDVIGSIEGGGTAPTQVWADGIVLGGYSRKAGSSSTSYRGADVKMKATSHIYDDLELNATGSSFALNGSYYGYNYASTDNRTYSAEFLNASTNRKFLSGVKINDGNYKTSDGTEGHLVGQAHYNSSAVVVNGEESTLDLSKTEAMYIAGQAYVEMSKSSVKKTYEAGTDSEGNVTWTEVNPNDPENTNDRIKTETYSYDDLNPDGTLKNDNYTLDYEKNPDGTYKLDGEGKRIPKKTRIQDFRTGEGLSVKSNQLAYIPPYQVRIDTDGSLYVKWPEAIKTSSYFNSIWADLEKVPVIETMVAGSKYYFYDFSQTKINMNTYMEEYAKLFDLAAGETRTKGDLANFYDITNYAEFKVGQVIVNNDKIYSNSAISYKSKADPKLTIKADNKSLNALVKAKDSLNGNDQGNLPSASVGNEGVYSQKVTVGLQKRYKEMKMLLTDSSIDTVAISNAYAANESEITPINYYFDFSKLDGMITSTGSIQAENTMDSRYKVFLGTDNVQVNTSNVDGKVQGIVICKGDVTFGPNVKKFEGLIVSGGKIKTNQSIDFVSNPEIIKSILRECDESKDSSKDRSAISSLFRQYNPISSSSGSSGSSADYESMKSIAAVQYEDILAFQNWKKNVD